MEFRILGPLEVRSEGKDVDLGGPQPRKLLAALLSQPNKAISADRLAQELWGQEARSGAAKAVQVPVSRLRKLLGGRIETTPPPTGYRLRVEPDELDAERFSRIAAQARRALAAGAPDRAGRLLSEALGIWRGAPFDGLDVGPTARAEAELMAENRRAAQDARIAAELAAGHHDQVVGELRRALRVDPTDEAVAVSLMVAHYRCGRQLEALEVFAHVRERLAELGLTPGPSLQSMQRRVLDHDPGLAFAPTRGHPNAPPPLPPVLEALPQVVIVGREDEQARLRRIVAQAEGEARRVVLIGGEAGVGKTRLAAETAVAAHSAGFAVGWGAAAEGLSAPYGMWHDALSHLVTHTPAERLADHIAEYGTAISRLLPSFDRQSSTLAPALRSAPETERDLLFAAIARLLRTLCATQPVALVLDDLHWANPQSLRLLRYVAGDTPDLPLLVIGTYRDRDVPQAYPVSALHADLKRLPDAEPPDGAPRADGGVVSMELRRLTRGQVLALVTAMAGHDIGPGGRELADALSDETQGNPFFVREVLRHLRDSGSVGQDPEGRWRLLRPISELGLPEGVHDVVARRVAQLGVDAASILAVASVIGGNFDTVLLDRLVALGEDRVADALDAASGGRVLVEVDTPPKHYAFAHACFQHSLYERLRPRERMRHHVAVAAALEACNRGDPVERAHHWVTAGDPDHREEAVHYARRAGEIALEQLAPDDAVRWFEAARDRLAGNEVQLCDVLTRLGLAQRQVGGAFGKTLSAACEIAERLGDRQRLARAVLANTAGPFGAAGHGDEARIHWLDLALTTLPDGAPQVPLIRAILGKELYFGEEPKKGALHCRQALQQARAQSGPRELADVLAYATAISPITPPDKHAALCRELAGLAEQLDDLELRFEAASATFIRAMHVGDLRSLDEGLAAMAGLAADSGLPILRWTALWSGSARRLIAGDLDGAEEMAEAAAKLARSHGVANGEVLAFGQRVGIAAERGTLAELAAAAEILAREHPGLPLLQLARTFIAAETGREEAVAGFAGIAARGYRFRYEQTRAACLARCADIALRLGERAEYEKLYRALGPYAERFATPAGISSRGSIHLSLGRLASALGKHMDAERHFDAAERAHDLLSAPLLQARTYLARGEALVGREPDAAVGVLRHAHRLAARHGATSTAEEATALIDSAKGTKFGTRSSALLS